MTGQGNSGRSVVIDFPLPPQELSPNGRFHWAVKSRAKQDYSAECAAALLERRPRDFRLSAPVRLDAVWFLAGRGSGDGRYRPADRDNAVASLKAAIDALVGRGVLPGDRSEQLHLGQFTFLRTQKQHAGRAGVSITLTEIGGDE